MTNAVSRTAVAFAALALLTAACGVFSPGSGIPDYQANTKRLATQANLRAAEAATVRIRNLGCGALSTGSGIVIGERTLLTNAHVVAGAETLEINLWDGTTIDADVTGAASGLDLARVEVGADLVNAHTAQVAELADTDPEVGEEVFVFGFPEGGVFTILSGETLAYEDVDGKRSLIISNEVVPGNSGGPVLDPGGSVVGVVQAQIADTGAGVAIPVSTVESALATSADAPLGAVPGCDAFPPTG